AFSGLFNGGAVLTRTPGPRRNASYGPGSTERFPSLQPSSAVFTRSEPIWWSAVPLRDRNEVLLDIKSPLCRGEPTFSRKAANLIQYCIIADSWFSLVACSRHVHFLLVRFLLVPAALRNRRPDVAKGNEVVNAPVRFSPEGKAVGKHPGVDGDTRILEVCMVFTSSACRHHIYHYIAMGLGTSTLPYAAATPTV
ncbi:unnamed protein product, partial [Darwinula stevensoni]